MAALTEGHNASIAEFVPELDRLAVDVMADWKVPGAALAVVQDGKLALAKAYGQRDVEANLAVTPTTQFVIGSITNRLPQPAWLSYTMRGGSTGPSRCATISRSFV
jgi:hypothetical protein